MKPSVAMTLWTKMGEDLVIPHSPSRILPLLVCSDLEGAHAAVQLGQCWDPRVADRRIWPKGARHASVCRSYRKLRAEVQTVTFSVLAFHKVVMPGWHPTSFPSPPLLMRPQILIRHLEQTWWYVCFSAVSWRNFHKIGSFDPSLSFSFSLTGSVTL